MNIRFFTGIFTFLVLSLAIPVALHAENIPPDASPSGVTQPAPSSSPELPSDNPCLTEPDSPACSSYQLLQQLLQDRQAREQQALEDFINSFANDFGYDPRDYTVMYHLAGDNITIFGKSDWLKLQVQPEAGLITVEHISATRDAFWGTMVWHDHEILSTNFTLDEDACELLSDGKNCTFTGVDTIDLGQNFLTNHQLYKHGQWEIRYIENEEEKGIIHRISDDALPEGMASSDRADHDRRYCQLFPTSLDCQ